MVSAILIGKSNTVDRGVNLTGARPKTDPAPARVKNSDLAAQVTKLSQEFDLKMKMLEDKIAQQHACSMGSHQQQPVTETKETSFPLTADAGLPNKLTQQVDNPARTITDLYNMFGLTNRIEAELNELPLGRHVKDKDIETFYRQLVQDTVKEVSGKLKIKSGLDLESQELALLANTSCSSNSVGIEKKDKLRKNDRDSDKVMNIICRSTIKYG